MLLQIETTLQVEDENAEIWIVQVTISSQEENIHYTVSITDYDLTVRPAPAQTKCRWQWNDYIFANINGSIEEAAVICALATHFKK